MENSGGSNNVVVTGEKIWTSLVRYLYQKVTPSQIFAMMIIMSLCHDVEEVSEQYCLLDPSNNYELVPARNTNKKKPVKPTLSRYFLDKLSNSAVFCYQYITADSILLFLRRTGWATGYVTAVTEIVDRRRIRNQNPPGSSTEDLSNILITDPITESELAKEILTYLDQQVSSEDILILLKATPWSKDYVGYIEDFIKMYQSNQSQNQNPST